MFDQNITAHLVYDGGDQIYVPSEMGTPNANQLTGTTLENLSEVALRICYDSLGATKSRSSADAHKHIKEVKHLSVFEHANFTVRYKIDDTQRAAFLSSIVGRPGTWLEMDGSSHYRLTVNFRTVLEWKKWSALSRVILDPVIDRLVENSLLRIGGEIAPLIITAEQGCGSCLMFEHVTPDSPSEIWCSLYLSSSRGVSHEQVRHGDYTAISQRSTRFVDEDGSNFIEHPLVSQFMNDMNTLACSPDEEKQREGGIASATFRRHIANTDFAAREAYRAIVKELEPYLVKRGVDKFTARKQARGAARLYLPNALQTEMIFSANVNQWLFMLSQRATVHADAEIRLMYVPVFEALSKSRYADRFAHLELAPSPDGIGQIVQQKKA